jgi:hypothetical protein
MTSSMPVAARIGTGLNRRSFMPFILSTSARENPARVTGFRDRNPKASAGFYLQTVGEHRFNRGREVAVIPSLT